MRAWVLHGMGDLRLEEVSEPALADNEVLIRIMAAGICGSDIPRIYRGGAYFYPLIPGHEFAGVAVKAGAASGRWIGRRVGIFPLIPCENCEPCRKKQYEMCRHYSYLGSRRDGGFAEYAAVPAWNLIELPENAAFEEAAMLEPMSVAVHAVRRIAPASSAAAAVCGLGTIGLSVLMFLMEAGIERIFAIGNRKTQLEAAVRLGIPRECCCDSTEQDAVQWLLACTGGAGAEVFFECVGKNETLVQAVEGTAPGGKILAAGNPYSDMQLKKDIYWKILRNQLTVTGTWNSSFWHSEEDDWHYVLQRLADRAIAPAELITHRLSFEELDRGLEIMRDKREEYIKIMGVRRT